MSIRRWLAPAALLAALTLTMAAWLPAAAQTDEADLVGVYQTEAMDNEITGEVIVQQWTLLPDNTLETLTIFVLADSASIETGTWALDDDGNLVATMERRIDPRGGRIDPIEPPFDIVFTIEDEGDTLVAEDWLAYGPRDLVLARTDQEPVSMLDDEGELMDDLKTGLAEFPDSLFVGTYRTLEYEVKGEPRWLGLELLEDGDARVTFPPTVDEDVAYVHAEWRNNGDGTVSVTQIADIGLLGEVLHTYDPPLLFSDLTRTESGALFSTTILLPDGSQPIFSPTNPDGSFIYEFARPIPGVYAGVQAAGDGAAAEGLLYSLGEEGDALRATLPLDGSDDALTDSGVWELNGMYIAITWTTGADAVVEELMVMVDGRLEGDGFILRPVDDADTDGSGATAESEAGGAAGGGGPTVPAGENVTFMTGREQLVAGYTVVLSLQGDGTANMSTQLTPDGPSLLEFGVWDEAADGTITLTFDRGLDQQPYDEPQVLVFERSDERTLTATDYDADRYGEDLILYDTRHY